MFISSLCVFPFPYKENSFFIKFKLIAEIMSTTDRFFSPNACMIRKIDKSSNARKNNVVYKK